MRGQGGDSEVSAPKRRNPGDMVQVEPRFIAVLQILSQKLDGLQASWSLIGDLAEEVRGINAEPNQVDILTSKEGVEEIRDRLIKYSPTEIQFSENILTRAAAVEGKNYPVTVRSRKFEAKVDSVGVTIEGDLQIRVGEWEWGDPLEFEPEEVYVVGSRVPVIPLRLLSELYLELGWSDKLANVTMAMEEAHHHMGHRSLMVSGMEA